MSADTQQKRANMINLGTELITLPVPDSSIDRYDRAQLLGTYLAFDTVRPRIFHGRHGKEATNHEVALAMGWLADDYRLSVLTQSMTITGQSAELIYQ